MNYDNVFKVYNQNNSKKELEDKWVAITDKEIIAEDDDLKKLVAKADKISKNYVIAQIHGNVAMVV